MTSIALKHQSIIVQVRLQSKSQSIGKARSKSAESAKNKKISNDLTT